MEQAIVQVIALFVVQRTKVLLVRRGEMLQFPGGKQEAGETELECLRREVREEIPDALPLGLERWRTFTNLTSPRSGYPMNVVVYRGKIKWGSEIPRAEEECVTEVLWWQRCLDDSELTEPTRRILKAAKKEGIF